MRTKPFSGVVANQWRRKLAAAAERNNDATRTLKFPLDLSIGAQQGDMPVWEAVTTLHRVVASDAPGSLIRLIYDLLLSGFRIFGKTAETEAFRNRAVLDDASWHQCVCAHSELTVAADSFVPSEIYKRLLVAPRAVGGKDNAFRAEVIATEYAKFFCKGKHGENIPAPEQALFNALGEALFDAFPSWRALADNLAASAQVIDGVLIKMGYGVPAYSLSSRIAALRPIDPPGTLAFDPVSPSFTDTDGVEPHMIVARALHAGRAEGLTAKPDLVKFAQAFFSGDANHGGLSWIFGKGMEFFRVNDHADICAAFDVPNERMASIEQLRKTVLAIPEAVSTLLGGKSFSPYRSGIGGVLGSWVANYIARLSSLEETLDVEVEPLVLPAPLLADENLFNEIGTTPGEIDALCQQVRLDRNQARAALDRLMGKAEGVTADDVATMESYNTLLDTLAGLLSQVQESIVKAVAIAEATRDTEAREHLKGYAFATPKWIARMEKLNRLDLSPTNPQEELQAAAAEFSLLHDAMHAHYSDILTWAQMSGETLSPLKRLAAQEAQYTGEGGKRRNPDEQAFRNCMNRLGRAARKCSEPMLRAVADFFVTEGVFADRSHLNQFFFNRRGSLYKSPFDRNPRQPFAITRASFEAAPEIMARFARFIADRRKQILGASRMSLIDVTDLFRMERAHFGVLLAGFPEELPTELALPAAVKDVFNLPLPVRLRMVGSRVSSAVMRKIFNHYYVRLESLAAVLLRDRFFLRAKFQRAGENALLYAPVDQPWQAPARLYASAKPIGEAMRRLERAAGGQTPIDPPLALAGLLESYEDNNEPSLRAYLRQAPHDWYFPWPASGLVSGLLMDKTGCSKRLVKTQAKRLIGSPAYKGILDRMLSAPDEVQVGDVAMIVDRHYAQSAHRTPDGRIDVEVAPLRIEVNVALPVTEAKSEPAALSFKNYVAIDLGERGLGYAVFDAANHQLIEKGRVKVRSMHILVQDDHSGRRKVSSALRFRAPFDPAEERRRENVVGDFCQAINRLMWYYNAFPVLEYAAGGASSAIDKVFKAVADHYLFSTTPTVNNEREAYWKGASYWKHPTLLQQKFDKATGKKGSKIEPLSLFPGSGTSAYGTSQACSCCGRNPVEAARELINGNRKAVIPVQAGGTVELGNGVITLYLAAKDSEREAARRANRNTPLSSVLPAGAVSGDDLLRLISRNLRQPPPSRQTRDTRQSIYHCLYEDCGVVLHAEENAGVNIGRKWAADRPGAG